MHIIRQDGKPVNVVLHRAWVHVLEVTLLSWENDGDAKCAAQDLAQFMDQVDLVLGIGGTRPLPVDLDLVKLPLVQELLERINKGFAVLLGAGHVGPCEARLTVMRHGPFTDCKTLVNARG